MSVTSAEVSTLFFLAVEHYVSLEDIAVDWWVGRSFYFS